jgi:hypothetical protein
MSGDRLSEFLIVAGLPEDATHFVGGAMQPPAILRAPAATTPWRDLARGSGELLHPATAAEHTLPIWRGLGDRLWMRSEADLGPIDSRPGNILYFPQADARPGVVLHDRVNNRYCCYRSMPVPGIACQAATDETLRRALYQQVEESALAGLEVRRYTIEVNADACQGEPAGWLNPLIVRVGFDGDALRPGEALERLARANAVLHVEPIFTEEWLGRLGLQRAIFQRWRDAFIDEVSAVEALHWGRTPTASSAPWRPFLALDGLGGSFHLENHGDLGATWTWAPPVNAAVNRLWFARHWLAALGMQDRPAPEARSAVPPPAIVRPWQRPVRRIDVDHEWAGAAALLRTAGTLLASFRGGRYRSDREALLGWLGEVIEREGLDALNESHRGHYSVAVTRGEVDAVLFDEAQFLDAFAEQYVAPHSPVTVAMPEGTDAVRLTTSAGHRDLLLRWFRATGAAASRVREAEIAHRFGWWNDWYGLLYTATLDVRLTLRRPPRGFRLGFARLGQNVLGPDAASHQSDTFYRF